MAIKSTRKEVKERIRAYIKECVNAELEGREMTLDDLIKETNLVNEHPAVTLTNYSLVFTPYIEEERELIKSWLEETDEEANKYNPLDVNAHFIHLIGRELEKALDVKYRLISNRQGYRGYHTILVKEDEQ